MAGYTENHKRTPSSLAPPLNLVSVASSELVGISNTMLRDAPVRVIWAELTGSKFADIA